MAKPAPDWDALFQRQSGWIGADGAYSIPLSTNLTLWLFGDTFIGGIKGGKRINARMINNSIALQRGTNQPEFFYRTTPEGKADSFFKPQDGRGYIWPFHGVRTGKKLYLFLHQMENVKTGGPFGFRFVANWFAVIANPDEPPLQWHITQIKLPFTQITSGGELVFGSAVMMRGGNVYIFGTDSRGGLKKSGLGRDMVLAKVDAAKIEDFNRWHFWAGDKWEKDFTKVTPLVEGMASEFSVSFQPTLKQFVLVYTEGGLSGNILLRTAPAAEGPWSEATLVYQCPEKDLPVKAFCYAAKAHPELPAAPNELLITYAANSWDFANLINEPRLYWPRFVCLKWDRAPAQ